jgi:hypothetical protein
MRHGPRPSVRRPSLKQQPSGFCRPGAAPARSVVTPGNNPATGTASETRPAPRHPARPNITISSPPRLRPRTPPEHHVRDLGPQSRTSSSHADFRRSGAAGSAALQSRESGPGREPQARQLANRPRPPTPTTRRGSGPNGHSWPYMRHFLVFVAGKGSSAIDLLPERDPGRPLWPVLPQVSDDPATEGEFLALFRPFLWETA